MHVTIFPKSTSVKSLIIVLPGVQLIKKIFIITKTMLHLNWRGSTRILSLDQKFIYLLKIKLVLPDEIAEKRLRR